MRFSSGALSLLTQDIGTGILQLALSVYTARILGPAQLGTLVIFLVVIQYADKLGKINIGDACIYHVGKKDCGLSEANFHLFRLSLIQAGLITAAFCLLWPWIERIFFSGQAVSPVWAALAALHIPALYFLLNARKLFLSAKRVDLYNRTVWPIPALQLGTLAAWGFIAGKNKLGIGEILAVSLAVQSVSATWGQISLNKFAKDPVPVWNGHLAGLLWKTGWRFYTATLPNFIQMRLDLLLIAYFLPSDQAAFYSLATTSSEMLWKLPNAAQSLLFPASASLSIEDSGQFTLNTCRHLILLLSILSAVGAFLIYPAVRLLYGHDFMPVALIFLLLLPGITALGVAKAAVSYFQGRGITRLLFRVYATACLLNLTLNLTLIPAYEALGAAMACSLTYSFTAVTFLFHLLREIKKPWSALIPTREDVLFYPQRLNEIVAARRA